MLCGVTQAEAEGQALINCHPAARKSPLTHIRAPFSLLCSLPASLQPPSCAAVLSTSLSRRGSHRGAGQWPRYDHTKVLLHKYPIHPLASASPVTPIWFSGRPHLKPSKSEDSRLGGADTPPPPAALTVSEINYDNDSHQLEWRQYAMLTDLTFPQNVALILNQHTPHEIQNMAENTARLTHMPAGTQTHTHPHTRQQIIISYIRDEGWSEEDCNNDDFLMGVCLSQMTTRLISRDPSTR